tara:strand:+ start:1343 stop:2461 length:1119 start_codon:yes stop_codon:yes gene_type:complete
MRIDLIKDKSEARDRLIQKISNHDQRGIENEEFLSYMIINAALLVLPCTKIELIKHLKTTIGSIYEEVEIEEFLDRHINHQDMIEIFDEKKHKTKLFPSSPRYVKSQDGRCFLIGIGIEDPSFGHGNHIDPQQRVLLDKLRYSKHLRFWDPQDFESKKEMESLLFKSSIIEAQVSEWIDDLFVEKSYYNSPQSFMNRINARLADQDYQEYSLRGAKFLDHSLSSNNYARRFLEISASTDGRYIVRTGEKYETVYLYAEIEKGKIIRTLSFNQIDNEPIRDHKSIALMIQMAIDYLNNNPQTYFIEPGMNNSFILKLNHLVPDWVQKHLISFGKPGPARNQGDHYLISFELDSSMREEVEETLSNYWLKKRPN